MFSNLHKMGGYSLIILITALIFSACDNQRVFDTYEEIPGYTWNNSHPVVFKVNIPDTSQRCRVILNINNSTEYPYRNIYMFMDTTYPDGSKSRDTLEYYFNDESGKPLGKCSDDICENHFLLKEGVKFEEKGEYEFRFSHAMRSADGNLPHILNLGLRIENME